MIKKLAKHGNSFALVLDKAILELLDIKADTPLMITTDGHSLTIAPIKNEASEARLKTAIEKVNTKYADLFKRLA